MQYWEPTDEEPDYEPFGNPWIVTAILVTLLLVAGTLFPPECTRQLNHVSTRYSSCEEPR